MLDSSALVVNEQDAEVVRGGGTKLWLLADSSDTEGTLGANRIRLDSGVDGAKPHYHALCTEAFYVLEGELQILLDDEVITIGKGGYVAVPPGMRHSFAAAPGSVADLLVTLTPGVERFEYFRILPAIMRGEVAEDSLAAIHDKYDVHFVDSSIWTSARSSLD